MFQLSASNCWGNF